MLVRVWRFATLVLVSLSMGMAFCHALELPPKIEYEASVYLLLHRTLYRLFGPPLGGFIEGGAVLMSIVLVLLVRKRRPAFALTLVGAASMVLAHVIWWLWVNPANLAMAQMPLDSAPSNWIDWRNQWDIRIWRVSCCSLPDSAFLLFPHWRKRPANSTRS